MGKQLFGTDGIRGVAGEYPLDPLTVYAFGVALGKDAAAHAAHPEILIGTDTRESGSWIAEMVAGGLASQGAKRALRRSDHDARRGLPHAHRLVRGGRGDFGVAQSVSGQRPESVRP